MKVPLFRNLFCAVVFCYMSALAQTLYVWKDSPSDGPGTEWSNAFHEIQSAVDAASAGYKIIVTNGVYDTGGALTSGTHTTNRVAVTAAIRIESVNGAEYTIIRGAPDAGSGDVGDGAVRGVYLASGAELIGFTITNGYTMTSGTVDQRGGGVFCQDGTARINGCRLLGNYANTLGGGSYKGTLTNCVVAGNYGSAGGGVYSADIMDSQFFDNESIYYGGAVYDSVLTDCDLYDNYSPSGGAAYDCELTGCNIISNKAQTGGGTYMSSLNDCTLTGNEGQSSAGGSYRGTLVSCSLIGNMTDGGGGGANGSTLVDCVLTGNSANSGGGAYSATLSGCIIHHNTAIQFGGGASYYGMLTNCVVYSNTAGSHGGGIRNCDVFNCTIYNNSAVTGGGVVLGSLYNCSLHHNTASDRGGASQNSTLINCTLYKNSAANGGGGASSGTLKNCIVSYNFRGEGISNWDSTYNPVMAYCCTIPLPVGEGNTTANPRLLSADHISPCSPCIGAASNIAVAVDIDGESWLDPPSIGCDEFHASGSFTGELSVAINGPAVLLHNVSGVFDAEVAGMLYSNSWDFGDGTLVADMVYASHTWSITGDYPVIFTAYNSTYPGGISATQIVQVYTLEFPVIYVWQDSPQNGPGSSWANAFHVLQDGVDAQVLPNGIVRVTNGVYETGGSYTQIGDLFNRVVIPDSVRVESVNGPASTIIMGSEDIGGGNGNNAVRGVYMEDGAELTGFTVTNGHTQLTGFNPEVYAGGIFCEGTNALIGNCIISGNDAYSHGGGVYQGSLSNCLISGNYCNYGGGGGSRDSLLINCTVSNNIANMYGGGGVRGGILIDCVVVSNTAPDGGGAYAVELARDSTFIGNTAIDDGGGVYSAEGVTNCIFSGNSSGGYGGGGYDAVMTDCVIAGNSSASGGGVYECTLTDCTLMYNSAALGGATCSSDIDHCTVVSNTAHTGGGTYQGTVKNGVLFNNSATLGGGSAGGSLWNCIISNNTAVSMGGGAYNGIMTNCDVTGNSAYWGGGTYDVTAYSCQIHYNVATNGGGAVGFNGIYAGALYNSLIAFNTAEKGGGIYRATYYMNIRGCTVARNKATDGGGIFFENAIYFGEPENCIFYRNKAGTDSIEWGGATQTCYYCCTTPDPGGTGNITGDPLFINSNTNLNLQASSPCIDAGIDSEYCRIDLRGVYRPLDGNNDGVAIMDMGAYEYIHSTVDTDGDSVLDFEEYVADTDGTDSNDWFRITALINSAVYFNSSSRRQYSLLSCTNLLEGVWMGVPGQQDIMGCGGIDCLVDPCATNPGCFYKVQVEIP